MKLKPQDIKWVYHQERVGLHNMESVAVELRLPSAHILGLDAGSNSYFITKVGKLWPVDQIQLTVCFHK